MLPTSKKTIHPSLRRTAITLFLLPLLLFSFSVASKATAVPDNSRYDVLYIWDADLRNLQDYKEELESQLGGEVSKDLHLIQRGDRYGMGTTMPDTITLYQKPIEEVAADMARVNLDMAHEVAVRQVIRDTIWHEVAHHFGMDEHTVRHREDIRDNL